MGCLIIAPGPLKQEFIASGLFYYQKLIQRFLPIQIRLPKLKGRFLHKEERIKAEERLLLEEIASSHREKSFIVLLDERGKALNTLELSSLLSRQLSIGRRLIFLVGGPEGSSESLKQRADFVLSLSNLTLNHELTILVLAEALYRALSLLHGHPYHRA